MVLKRPIYQVDPTLLDRLSQAGFQKNPAYSFKLCGRVVLNEYVNKKCKDLGEYAILYP